MYPRTRTTLAILAALFWAAAIGVLIYAIEIDVPRIPVFGFFAIAGSMFGVGWFNLFIHRNVAIVAAPAAPAAAATSGPDRNVVSADDCNAPTVRLARRIPSLPRPRTYVCDPDQVDRMQMTVEMVPITEITPKIVKAYSLGDANGYDRAVADMAGVRLDGDART